MIMIVTAVVINHHIHDSNHNNHCRDRHRHYLQSYYQWCLWWWWWWWWWGWMLLLLDCWYVLVPSLSQLIQCDEPMEHVRWTSIPSRKVTDKNGNEIHLLSRISLLYLFGRLLQSWLFFRFWAIPRIFTVSLVGRRIFNTPAGKW